MLILRRILLVCSFAFVALAVTARDASASHFRYGSMTWQVVNPAQPNVVKVRFDAAFRWSFPWGGSTPSLCPAGLPIPPNATGNGGCPVVGTVLNLGAISSPVPVRVGTSAGTTTSIVINLVVTSTNATEDWLTGTFEATLTYPLTAGDFMLQFDGCCRLSNLLDNNHDANYSVRTRVTVRLPPNAVNQPPTVATLPILTLARGQPAVFTIPASDPNGDAITFSIPPLGEAGLMTTAPVGFSLSATGAVSWTPTVVGLYAVQVKATDSVGAYTVADFLLNVKELTGQPPSVLINGFPGPQSLTILYGTPVTFTVNGADPENTPVLLSSSALPLGATMSPSLPTIALNPQSTFNWTPPQPAIGTYVLNFAALDGDGRQTTNSMTVAVIGNPPTISCTAPDPIEATGPAGGLFSLSADLDDPDHDKLTMRVFVDGVLKQSSGLITPPATHTFSGTFALGTHTYEGRVGDGLTTASCTGTFSVVDTHAPSITVTPGNQQIPAASGAGAVATYTVTATDDVDPNPTVTCSMPSGATFPIGTTSVTCTATDDSGNTASTSFDITVFDHVAPVITVPADIVVEATGPGGADVSFAADATDAVDGAVAVTCVPASGWMFAVGTTQVDCWATDEAGNRASAGFQVIVTDTTAPDFAAPANILAEATSPTGAVVVYAVPMATDIVDLIVPVTCIPAPGSAFTLGLTTVNCTATDQAGNTRSRDFQVLIVDTTPPAIAPHADMTIEAESAAGASVVYDAPATSDAVSGAGVASCSPPSGTLFPMGTTLVTCVAADTAGNPSASSFNVTVADTTPPTFDPGSLGARTVMGNCGGANLVFALPTATDTVSAAIVTCAPLAGTSSGANTVTCTATDAAGNSTQTNITVDVLQPLQIVFTSPLSDDNVANDVDTDADVANSFKVGQTIPVKVRLLGCGGQDVTATAPVTVKLSVTTGPSGGGSNLINGADDFSGVGSPDGTMSLTGGQYHFNLATNSAEYPGGGQQFRALVTATYAAVPTLVAAVEDARLQSK